MTVMDDIHEDNLMDERWAAQDTKESAQHIPQQRKGETVRCGIKLQECYSYCRDHCERDVCEYQERTASPVA